MEVHIVKCRTYNGLNKLKNVSQYAGTEGMVVLPCTGQLVITIMYCHNGAIVVSDLPAPDSEHLL